MADIDTDHNWPNVQLVITDAQGRPAMVDGVPVWASSDATVITVTPAPDGMSALIDTVAPSTAPVRVTVTADADLGAGVVDITGVTEDINVTAGPSHQASTISLTLGAPVAKP